MLLGRHRQAWWWIKCDDDRHRLGRGSNCDTRHPMAHRGFAWIVWINLNWNHPLDSNWISLKICLFFFIGQVWMPYRWNSAHKNRYNGTYYQFIRLESGFRIVHATVGRDDAAPKMASRGMHLRYWTWPVEFLAFKLGLFSWWSIKKVWKFGQRVVCVGNWALRIGIGDTPAN